jgi:hypothetical protein
MDLAAKLQIKPGQLVECLRVPDAASSSLDGIERGVSGDDGSALLVYVSDSAVLEENVAVIAMSAASDRLTWVAYPKSGQLGTDLKRDSLAGRLIEAGIHPVRQIAIDEVWSALRFRPG